MKFGKGLKLAVILASLGAFVTLAVAGRASETKGKYYFKKNCKTCHAKGSENGEVTPLTKTQAQWKAYIESGKHAKGKEQISKYLTPEQIQDVEAFLVAHASDSPQPETCGG
jgi:mono/diheme cytochrome c family protein